MHDLAEVQAAVDTVIAEVGEDFIYNATGNPAGCYYLPLGELEAVNPVLTPAFFKGVHADDSRRKTGCLVGRAFDVLGITAHRTREMVSASVADIVDEHPDLLSRAAYLYLATVQQSQDQGKTWGKAREAGLATAADYAAYPAKYDDDYSDFE